METVTSPRASEKRAAVADQSSPDVNPPGKRLRVEATESTYEPEFSMLAATDPTAISDLTCTVERLQLANEAGMARAGLQRSIVLILNHVGFDSASREALESLTSATETYLLNFVANIKRLAESARREHPTPADYEYMLRKYNISTSSLKPHLKNPVAKTKLRSAYEEAVATEDRSDSFRATPTTFLGPELDGNLDKQEKPYIPRGLPPFPSKHTYKSTLAEAGASDPVKKRAEALADTQKGEKALRKINRATRISQQKELKELAQRDTMSRQRHSIWEVMMQSVPGQGSDDPSAEPREVADHSVIVDSSMRYRRREAPRASNRKVADAMASKG